MANLYYGDTSREGDWELRYTGIPVIILDRGETKSRDKRRIQILLAERGTCFTLWQDIIDNLSAYKVAGQAFHTMFLSTDHRKLIGFSFDSVEAADELWSHIDRLTSCPENISLSVPAACSSSKRNKKPKKKPLSIRLPEKSNISQPCCFQHVTNVHLTDRSRYFSMQTLLPVLPVLPDHLSSPKTTEHDAVSSSDGWDYYYHGHFSIRRFNDTIDIYRITPHIASSHSGSIMQCDSIFERSVILEFRLWKYVPNSVDTFVLKRKKKL